jgi:hypothetical protein
MKGPLTLLLLLLAGAPLHADIYKCSDDHGDTQYSDVPCGSNRSIFVPRAAPQTSGDEVQRLEKTRRLLRAYELEHAQEQREATSALADSRAAEKNCNAARARLRGLTQARVVYRLDEEGNRMVLSFDERAAAEEKARIAVTQWCD